MGSQFVPVQNHKHPDSMAVMGSFFFFIIKTDHYNNSLISSVTETKELQSFLVKHRASAGVTAHIL